MAKKRKSKGKNEVAGCVFIAVIVSVGIFIKTYPLSSAIIVCIAVFSLIWFQSAPWKHRVLSHVSSRNYKKLSKLEAPAGYVYVIKDTKYLKYKIGFTIHPKQRIKDIQRSEAGKLEYVHIVRTDDARATESYLHDRYKKFRIRKDREWFQLNNPQLQEIRDLGWHKQPAENKRFIRLSGILVLLIAIFIISMAMEQGGSPLASRNNQTITHDTSLSANPTRRPTSTRTSTATRAATSTKTYTPTAASTLTSTPRPTATKAVYYITTRNNAGARVRDCPNRACAIIGGLSPGTEIQALGRVEGEAVNGNNEWIEFRHNDTVAYVHGSLVSPNRPNQ